MKLLYGTGNLAKLQSMKNMLSGLDIEIIGLKDIKTKVDFIDESGNTPLENARIKAMAYYNAIKIPVFSCDSGLYIDGIEPHLQPGVHIRRVMGRELTDEEIIEYYSSLAREAGGPLKARYKNAICLVLNDGNIYEYDGDDIASEEFFISDKAHSIKEMGFPLDSLSIHIGTGKYYFDIKKDDISTMESQITKGLRDFFIKAII